MTRREAQRAVGHVVSWPNMDARINCTQTILERIGAHNIASVSYTVESRTERFLTFKHISELQCEG